MNADGVAAGTVRRDTPPAEAPHILVVDDDDRLRALLGRYLRDHGYHVSTASSAAEARGCARRHGLRPDRTRRDDAG